MKLAKCAADTGRWQLAFNRTLRPNHNLLARQPTCAAVSLQGLQCKQVVWAVQAAVAADTTIESWNASSICGAVGTMTAMLRRRRQAEQAAQA